MITERKAANAVGGKTARACDSCLCKRARWYCGADDAFLCQSCDASVHSANQLASRHKRVRLEKASNMKPSIGLEIEPAWHKGFTRKARTPRQKRMQQPIASMDKEIFINSFPLVPEIGGEDASLEEDEEEQLLYRVPVFDPLASELCNTSNEMENVHGDERTCLVEYEENIQACDLDNIHGFLPPDDMELMEFAADVESLLGTGMDDDNHGIEGLGLVDCKEEDDIGICYGNKVKLEDEEVETILACNLDPGLDMTRETLDWDFDYESPVIPEEEEEHKVVATAEAKMIGMGSESKEEVIRRSILLRLNYEGVISAWANQGSPWTTGNRPEFNPDDRWPDFVGVCSARLTNSAYGGGAGGSDGGREARVSRYREKRRTRLFAKKIRYEVRKLNAEKRPRMKGRFVKRASSVAAPPPAFPNFLKKK